MQLEWDKTQAEAINLCLDLNNKIACVTGPAGTGKSALLRKVYHEFSEAGYFVQCAAPTGKAAKRITEVAGIPAQTIHALLEFTSPGDPDPKTGKPTGISYPRRQRTYGNPLDCDVLLIDEYAMAHNELHGFIVNAMKSGAVVRVFGDINQLRPIEPHKIDQCKPSPFTRLLNKFPSVRLETIHRQGEGSTIISNCARVLAGKMPQRTDEFEVHITDQPVEAVRKLVHTLAEDGYDFRSNDAQIITLQNTTWVGTRKMNKMLQQELFPNRRRDEMLQLPRHEYESKARDAQTVRIAVDDKVIITKNDYELKIFNGESGIVKEIGELGEVVIDLGDREVLVPPLVSFMVGADYYEYDPRKNIDLAYALTTHKCQGSEYSCVLYLLNKSTSWMQNRNNTYTGLSRARQRVVLVADQQSLQKSIFKRAI